MPAAPAPRSWIALLKEQRYQRHVLREDARQESIVTAVLVFCFTAVARNDFILLKGSPLLGVSLASRAVFVVIAAVAFVGLRRAKWPRQQHRASNLVYAGLVEVLLGTFLTRFWTGQIIGPLAGAGALLAVLYFSVRGPLLPRVIVGATVTLISLALLFSPATVVDAAPRLAIPIVLLALNVIGVLSARAFEDQRRKRFEAERQERRARQDLAVKLRELAAEKERAEALSQARAAFLAAMSHEFRTPMNAVIGLSELLLEEPLAPQHGAHVRTISDSARALLALLEEILDFAKIDADKLALSPAPFALRKLVTSVVRMLLPAAEKRGVELALAIAADVPENVVGDDARLRQVLVNLVSNAIKFTEKGDVRLHITAREEGDGDPEIVFRVEDTGIGMTPEEMSRLFRPFEQADGGIARKAGGTGLGLAISRRIVVAMGGDISVTSKPGRGSVFSFALRLPAATAPPEAPAVSKPAQRPPLAILVVDDHPINREVARAKLGRLGYEVDLASDGPDAIARVAQRDYDVVFMDLQMPGMSGIEATRRIREQAGGRRVPHIVALTAAVFEEDREACRRAGMRDFVGKPIDLAQLEAVLARVPRPPSPTQGPPAP